MRLFQKVFEACNLPIQLHYSLSPFLTDCNVFYSCEAKKWQKPALHHQTVQTLRVGIESPMTATRVASTTVIGEQTLVQSLFTQS